MKKQVWTFGAIAGIIVSAFMAVSTNLLCNNPESEGGSMVLGFAAMIVAFSFIFVGIYNYREKKLGGVISFGKAFKLGFLIALVASTFYVVTWLIEYNFFFPDFMERYAEMSLKRAERSGADAETLRETAEQMEKFRKIYKSQVGIALITYVEILPVGTLMALVAAFVFKKKKPAVAAA